MMIYTKFELVSVTVHSWDVLIFMIAALPTCCSIYAEIFDHLQRLIDDSY